MKINELKKRLAEIKIEMQSLPAHKAQTGDDRYRQLEIEFEEIKDRLDCQEDSL